jgi:DNA-binding XRE family transcriptional regulator
LKYSDTVKDLRKIAGYTQIALADILGVNMQTVYRWESGESVPLPLLRREIDRMYAKAKRAQKRARGK